MKQYWEKLLHNVVLFGVVLWGQCTRKWARQVNFDFDNDYVEYLIIFACKWTIRILMLSCFHTIRLIPCILILVCLSWSLKFELQTALVYRVYDNYAYYDDATSFYFQLSAVRYFDISLQYIIWFLAALKIPHHYCLFRPHLNSRWLFLVVPRPHDSLK